MDWASIWPPLLGGTLIGLSAAVLLALTGKTAGISGIVDGVLRGEKGELGWKAAFVLGLIGGGVLISLLVPGSLPEAAPRALPWVLGAGVLVGFGTRLGGGCTSGHGVCGIGRTSGRGFVGTCVFIAVGALTVVIMRAVGA
jgi:uncharacterized membrane protein YedE/YeeE